MRRSDDLRDAEARDRIRRDTGSTLFVEAGAGSGKTQALVVRVQQLVRRGRHPHRADRGRDVHREGRRRAARPAARAVRAGGAPHDPGPGDGARRGRARRPRPAPRSAPCTPSRSASSASTRSRRASRRSIEVLDEVGSSVAFEDRWAQLRRSCWTTTRWRRPCVLAFAAGIDPGPPPLAHRAPQRRLGPRRGPHVLSGPRT